MSDGPTGKHGIKLPVRAHTHRSICDADENIVIRLTFDVRNRPSVIQALNGYGKAMEALNLIRNNFSTCSDSHREKAYETLNDLGGFHE